MSCASSPAYVYPAGFYPGNSAPGPTPYCPPGLSKYACRNAATACGGAPPSLPGAPTCAPAGCTAPYPHASGIFEPHPPCAGKWDGWTEVGYVYNTEVAPVRTYLTKSCTRCDVDPYRACRASACTACRATPIDADSTAVPALYRADLEPRDPLCGAADGGTGACTSRAAAFQRKTQWTNYGVGYGATAPYCTPRNSRAGWAYGVLHADGCRCNRCNQDPFYHPRTTVTDAVRYRAYRLFARQRVCATGTSRLQFAVAPMGEVDPPLTTLPADPRFSPAMIAQGCSMGVDERAWVELVTGDEVYIPGEYGPYFVHLYASNDVYRPNHSVFRGYSPVRPLRGKRTVTNSGLRNFTALPSAHALLRPF